MAEKLITKSFKRLLDKGIHRGFITYEELAKSLGKRHFSQQNLEEAFSVAGKSVVETIIDLRNIQEIEKKNIKVKGRNLQNLLYNVDGVKFVKEVKISQNGNILNTGTNLYADGGTPTNQVANI